MTGDEKMEAMRNWLGKMRDKYDEAAVREHNEGSEWRHNIASAHAAAYDNALGRLNYLRNLS